MVDYGMDNYDFVFDSDLKDSDFKDSDFKKEVDCNIVTSNRVPSVYKWVLKHHRGPTVYKWDSAGPSAI